MAFGGEVFVAVKPAVALVGALAFENEGQRLAPACRQWAVNEADLFAMEHALRLRESGRVERITCITAAPRELRDFLSLFLGMGADRAMRIVVAEDAGLDQVATGTLLGAAIRRMGGGLVLAGQRSDDGGSGIVPAATARAMGAAYLSNASIVELRDGQVEVERKLEAGNRQVWGASLPAVVAIESGSIQPRYVSVAGLLLAQRRPVEEISIDADSFPGPAVTQRLAVARVRPKKTVALAGGAAADRLKMMMSGGTSGKKEKRVLKGPPEQLAADVINLLRERQVLTRDGR